MTLLQMTAERHGTDEYDVKAGIEWTGDVPVALNVPAAEYGWTPTGLPIARYTPVLASVRAGLPDPDFLLQIQDLATDLINQGGLTDLVAVATSSD